MKVIVGLIPPIALMALHGHIPSNNCIFNLHKFYSKTNNMNQKYYNELVIRNTHYKYLHLTRHITSTTTQIQ